MAEPSEFEIYDQLRGLLPAQFEEVLLYAQAPREVLKPAAVAVGERAVELCGWMRASEPRRAAVQQALDRVLGRPGPAAAAGNGAADLPGLLASHSKAPIVVAVESADARLRPDELLETERHLTVTLAAAAQAELTAIGSALDVGLPLAQWIEAGRSAWQILCDAQPRLPRLVATVREAGSLQPVAWTGRIDLLLALHRALQAAHTGAAASDSIDDFLGIGMGAAYFSPLDDSRKAWTIAARSSRPFRFTRMAAEPSAQALADAAQHDVVRVESPDLPAALGRLADAMRTRSNPCLRVAIGAGGGAPAPDAAQLRRWLGVLPCVVLSGPGASLEPELLERSFADAAGRQAAPCIVAALRRAALLQGAADGAVQHALASSTWCWIGKPLFAPAFGDVPAAAYAHLMDLRSVAAAGWYFPRRKDIADPYQAESLIRAENPFHLYLTGAGGTGKSCFLRFVYERLEARPEVLAVWYRVDAPSSVWETVERRVAEETAAALQRKWPQESAALVQGLSPQLGDHLRELSRRLRAARAGRQVVVFVDQLERTFESGDEPDHDRLDRISGEVIDLLETVKTGEGVRVMIASRKQYLPDFLKSYQAASASGLHFNVLQSISEDTERVGFVDQVLRWCKEQNLVDERVRIDKAAARKLAASVQGHPLNLMLAMIQLLSRSGPAPIGEAQLDDPPPSAHLFDLDLEVLAKDELDWHFLLAMAHARTEIVRFEEVWWRLRMVDPKLTRRVDEMRPRGALERLWLLGHLGRTIYPRPLDNDPARFLEFFHANLRDHLLREVMGQGGSGAAVRREMPAAWRALDRLSAFAHEWEQTEQLLAPDDVAALMLHREAVLDRLVWPGEPPHDAFHLLFMRDAESARQRLCTAAAECLAFSALVHGERGAWAFENLFPALDDRVDCCRRWLRRCAGERRRPLLHYLVRQQVPAARDFLIALALADGSGLPQTLWPDLARVLTEPLVAVRYRDELLFALLEQVLPELGSTPKTADDLPPRVGEFFVAACGHERNELAAVLARCTSRLAAAAAERLQGSAALLGSGDLMKAWFGDAGSAAGDGDAAAEPAGEAAAPIVLVVGSELAAAIDAQRVLRWSTELESRLGLPLPRIGVAAGEVEGHEMLLRLRGIEVALGSFVPGRVQVLQRHWSHDAQATAYKLEVLIAQNDALQEVVLWLDPALLAQASWEHPAADFDAAVLDWLETMLRRSIDSVFGFDLLSEYLRRMPPGIDSRRLYRLLSLEGLRRLLVNLVREQVPLARRGAELLGQLQQIDARKMDPDTLTQKLREQVGEDLCRIGADPSGRLSVLLIDPELEDRLLGKIERYEDGRELRIDPAEALALASAVRREYERCLREDITPVLVCTPLLRRPLALLLQRFDPRVCVYALTELSESVAVAYTGLVAPPPAPAA